MRCGALRMRRMDLAIAIPLLTFCAGLLIGHWFALDRDKRKEYNAIAERARHELLKERAEQRGVWLSLNAVEWEQLESALPRWQRPSFRRAKAMRNDALADCYQDNMGGIIYPRPERFVQAADALLRYVKLR